MISNRHVRTDYKTWLDDYVNPQARYVAMCGRRVVGKNLGTPGVTDQPAVVRNKAGVVRPGWCEDCGRKTIEDIINTKLPAAVENELRPLYNHCVETLQHAQRKYTAALNLVDKNIR